MVMLLDIVYCILVLFLKIKYNSLDIIINSNIYLYWIFYYLYINDMLLLKCMVFCGEL